MSVFENWRGLVDSELEFLRLLKNLERIENTMGRDRVVPHPSGLSLDQRPIDELPVRPKVTQEVFFYYSERWFQCFTIIDKERELNEELVRVVREIGGAKSALTLDQIQDKISNLDFTAQFEKDGETEEGWVLVTFESWVTRILKDHAKRAWEHTQESVRFTAERSDSVTDRRWFIWWKQRSVWMYYEVGT